MLNKLRGVTSVRQDSKCVVGEFVTTPSEVANVISQFVLNVPMDIHVFIEGGLCYEN